MTLAAASAIPACPAPLAGDERAHATLLVTCTEPEQVLGALTHLLHRHGGRILEADQHAEQTEGRSFLRLRWDTRAFALDPAETRTALRRMARLWNMDWSLAEPGRRPRVAILASKAPHCLYDLLLSERQGELGGEVAAVLSNHEVLAEVAGHFAAPFHHVPVQDRAAAEAEQLRLLERLDVDLVVLARYMQILTPPFIARWAGRVINIHHSLLPAFVGARAYHQAWQRGVKLIGATAHYVTEELDQGPIIEQDACRVNHRDGVEQLVRRGCELERQVLTRAVRWHLDHRVVVAGGRTVVFT
jgi:formyltetrahydrofolate deformylase